jgi:hypothetical protein
MPNRYRRILRYPIRLNRHYEHTIYILDHSINEKTKNYYCHQRKDYRITRSRITKVVQTNWEIFSRLLISQVEYSFCPDEIRKRKKTKDFVRQYIEDE